MKRIGALFLTALLAFGAVGCGGEKETKKNDKKQEVVSEAKEEAKKFSLGETSKSKYENEFAGIGYHLNSGWSFYSDAKIRALNKATTEIAGEEFQALMEEADLVYCMFAADANEINNINMNMEKMSNEKLQILDLKNNFKVSAPMLKSTYENMGYTGFSYEITTVDIDGREVDAMKVETSISGVTLYQTLFAVKCDGYLASVTISTFYEDTTAEVLENIYWLD